MDNRKIIEEFFAAFGRRDAEGMVRHYHPELTFEDPVFGQLSHAQAANMWKMLCARGKDLTIRLVESDATSTNGHAVWEAQYTFSKTGKLVNNKVRSEFGFRDGLIVHQKDDFDFWRWASMALGTRGRLLGWTPLVKNAVRKEAKRSLAEWH
jgi:ketosteroid isomerase-like protein